ncbi:MULTISPECIES: hypothetical protein [Cyanophyceae]|uniref:Uncharacterized protein n=1 Tax=Leptolyngbya subtilissima DQ-A4 TaxID=2933933 RepID=A0ABV0KBZ2_9CYAN|nr:hypothetical protein [Nodosilinea sp. FACHB-141]MBD2111737.1 hypothetical protein [Nodosilinea sp. FACHB-141]
MAMSQNPLPHPSQHAYGAPNKTPTGQRCRGGFSIEASALPLWAYGALAGEVRSQGKGAIGHVA